MGTAIIISDAVMHLLHSHGFTRWALYEFTVQGKQGQVITGYSGIAIPGRCRNLEHSMSV